MFTRYLPHTLLASLAILAVVSSHAWKARDRAHPGFQHEIALRRTGIAGRWDEEMAVSVLKHSLARDARALREHADRMVIASTDAYDPRRDADVFDSGQTGLRASAGSASPLVRSADIERAWWDLDDVPRLPPPCMVRLRSAPESPLPPIVFLTRSERVLHRASLRTIDERTFELSTERHDDDAMRFLSFADNVEICVALQRGALGTRWEVESFD